MSEMQHMYSGATYIEHTAIAMCCAVHAEYVLERALVSFVPGLGPDS